MFWSDYVWKTSQISEKKFQLCSQIYEPRVEEEVQGETQVWKSSVHGWNVKSLHQKKAPQGNV